MANTTQAAAATHDCIECHGAGEFIRDWSANGRDHHDQTSCDECDGTGQVSPDCANCGEPADHGYVEADCEWRCYQCQLADEERASERAYRARTAGRPHWSTNEDHEYREAL